MNAEKWLVMNKWWTGRNFCDQEISGVKMRVLVPIVVIVLLFLLFVTCK